MQVGTYYEFEYGSPEDRRVVRGQFVEALTGERHTYYSFQLESGTLIALPVGEVRELRRIEEPLPDIS